jgi:hypothetical protein
MGTTEEGVILVLLVTGAFVAVAVVVDALVKLDYSQHAGSSGDKSNTATPRPPQSGLAEVEAGDSGFLAVPPGDYLKWPIPVTSLLAILGLLSAAAGSGGSPIGFATAFVLNPINWGMAYTAYQIGKIRCPHCRRSFALNVARNARVGSSLKCPGCGNCFIKPAG